MFLVIQIVILKLLHALAMTVQSIIISYASNLFQHIIQENECTSYWSPKMKILKYFPLIGILLFSSMQCSKKSRGHLSEATQTNQERDTAEGNLFLGLAVNGVVSVMNFESDGNVVTYTIKVKKGTANTQGAAELNLAGGQGDSTTTVSAPSGGETASGSMARPAAPSEPELVVPGDGGLDGAGGGHSPSAVPAEVPPPAPADASVPAKVQQAFVRVGGREIELPAGYYVEVTVDRQHLDTKTLGKGSQGTAFLVKDAEGKLWALKFDNRTMGPSIGGFFQSRASVLADVAASFQTDDVDVARSMQTGFSNPLEAHLRMTTTGIPVVIKTAVTGGTLKEAIQSGRLFDGPNAGAMQQDLRDLFYRMSAGKLVYEDLNTANLLWNPEINQWVVIDAKPPTSVDQFSKALVENVKSFLDKLPVGQSRRAYELKRELMGKIDKGLHLPSFALTPEQLQAQGEEFRQMSQLYANVQELLGTIPNDARREEAGTAQAIRVHQALSDDRLLRASPADLKIIGDEYHLTFEDWKIIGDRTSSRRPLRPSSERSRSAPNPALGGHEGLPSSGRPTSAPPPTQRVPVTPADRAPVTPDAPIPKVKHSPLKVPL